MKKSSKTSSVGSSASALISKRIAELGDWLAAEGCSDALNLDGGPSTAAAFRDRDGVVKIGPGVGLPYSIRFSAR